MKPTHLGRRTLPSLALIVAGVATAAGCVISPRETGLQRAVKAHDVEAVRQLLSAGASLNASFQDADSPYELALTNLAPSDPRTVEVLRLLITHLDKVLMSGAGAIGATGPRNRPADFIFKSNRQGSTPRDATSAVEIAVRQWSSHGVKVLVEHGLTIKSESVSDALVAGAGNGCVPALRVLLDAGADVNRPDRHGDTALRMARRMRNGEVAALLLGRGARGPKPGTEENAAKKKVENLIGSIIAPGAQGNPEDAKGQQWLEGADVVKHPIGQAAAKLGVPSADLQRGSALHIKGETAELHVFIPSAGAADPNAAPPPATAKHTLALDNGTWVFRAQN